MTKPAARLRGIEGRRLSDARILKQIPFATALALTRTAQDAQTTATRRISRTLDSPKPLTVRSVKIQSATKQGRPARVFVKDDVAKGNAPAKYLRALEFGGPRRVKRFERALQLAGALEPGEYAIPADGGSIDLRGNRGVGGIYTRILTRLRANPTFNNVNADVSGKGRRSRGIQYFRRGDFIWERLNKTKVRPILAVVRRPTYRRTLRFAEVVERTARRRMPTQWAVAVTRAISTAR